MPTRFNGTWIRDVRCARADRHALLEMADRQVTAELDELPQAAVARAAAYSSQVCNTSRL
jgi:hypothetical protein